MKTKSIIIIIATLFLTCMVQAQNTNSGTNVPDAEKMYGKKARKGKADAQYNLGKCYLEGRQGLIQDYSEAIKWFTKAAKQGNANAQYELGCCYKNGIGTEQDYEEATNWLRKAAEQGHSGAQNSLGHNYFYGKGVEQDFDEALKWFRKGAEQGNPNAQHWVGYCYETGSGVEKDLTEARRWLKKAADQGHEASIDELKRLDGVEFDGDIDNREADALYDMANNYFDGTDEIEQDYEKAMKWYMKAAEKGSIDALNDIGYGYYYGYGVDKDYKEAVRWFRKGAMKGNLNAQHWLGYCYLNGNGVIKDLDEAKKWLKKAADQGHQASIDELERLNEEEFDESHDNDEADALYEIANNYFDGTDEIEQDYEEAMKWYMKAAEKGSIDALNDIGYCYYYGYGVEQDYEEAVKWFKKGVEKGNLNCHFWLGFCYKTGDGIEQDKKAALELFKIAAAKGHEASINELEEMKNEREE